MTSDTHAPFSMHVSNHTPVILMPHRFSVLEAVEFKQYFKHLLETRPESKQIILDFSQTCFIDSSGIGAVVSQFKITRSQDIELTLHNLQPPVLAVFSMTGLDSVFKIPTPIGSNEKSMVSRQEPQLPETHPSVRSWIKRSLDIVGSLVGLVITGGLFLPIAIAIKLDSPGPILFSQTRCGWLGKEFEMLKFRSMYINAEALKSQVPNQANGAFFKNERDPRVTPVGRFLRRTSLDELPQFWNVLLGEMSLVGTRPPTPDEVERYDIPAWQRLDVKPGMTGEWQVNGRSKVRNFEDVIKLDLRYQEHWSLKHDLKLILKTIVLLLFRRNSGAV